MKCILRIKNNDGKEKKVMVDSETDQLLYNGLNNDTITLNRENGFDLYRKMIKELNCPIFYRLYWKRGNPDCIVRVHKEIAMLIIEHHIDEFMEKDLKLFETFGLYDPKNVIM